MIQYKPVVVLLFMMLATSIGEQAGAQVSKKKPKIRYRVDILAPLYLDELVKGGSVTYKDKMPDKAAAGVGFYAGVCIAADSMRKEGFNLDIYVHDVTSAKESPEKLTSVGLLDSTDLIIGAVQQGDIPLFSDFAKKKSINFIATVPVSPDVAYGNPYVTMLQPSLKTHCELIADDVLKKFPGEKVTLLYRTKDPADRAAYDYLTGALGKAHLQYISCNTFPRKENLGLFFETGKRNVIVVPVNDIEFADSLLHEMAHDFPATHFDIYGMPSWNTIADLRKEGAFPDLTVTVPVAYAVDASSKAGQYVKRVYKQVYAGKMPESVYSGYTTMFWYADLLRKYGVRFNESYNEHSKPQDQFDIHPETDKAGNLLYYENKRAILVSYGLGKTRK